jgi:hypothetical protein
MRDIAIKNYEEIHNKAHGDTMKARLTGVNDACKIIVDKGGIPDARNVLEWIVTNQPAANLSERTIYNKRYGGISPYLKIIKVWAAVAASTPPGKSVVAKKGLVSELRNELVTEADLRSISDPVVRHKVALLIGQYEGIRKQSEMRQAIKSNPPVAGFLTVGAVKDAESHDLALEEEEIEALVEFLNTRASGRSGIEFDAVGAVVIKRAPAGTRISKPGFVDAIRKIVTSYNQILIE